MNVKPVPRNIRVTTNRKSGIARDAALAIRRKLEGGDRRSIGRSNEVVADVVAEPKLFGAVFSGLLSGDPVLRARCADAVEKITRGRPEYLRSYRAELVGPLALLDQKEVRWHVAQMLPRIRWSAPERRRVVGILTSYLNDRSSIVKTFAMQALADLARQAPALLPGVERHLRELTVIGTPAMRARGRMLLKKLGGPARRSPRHAGKRR